MQTNGRVTFQPGAFVEEVLKNRNALPTELPGQVEFGVLGVCRITIALLLDATKHGGAGGGETCRREEQDLRATDKNIMLLESLMGPR